MNDELFYMSSDLADWDELYTLTSFKTNFAYTVYSGITDTLFEDSEPGTPFEIYIIDQALSMAACMALIYTLVTLL